MVLMNARPAHMVLAMANFVLLHAVVLGRRWALALTAVMVSLIGLSVWGGEYFSAYFSELAAQGQVSRELSKYTTLMRLITTAMSTGYLIVTTVSFQERSRSAVLTVNRELELAKADLQVRHDRERLLSELGAAAAAATDSTELRTLAEQTILQALDSDMVELSLAGDEATNGITIGSGAEALVVRPQQVLPDDDMRFLRTLVGLIDGAYTRIVAERRMFERSALRASAALLQASRTTSIIYSCQFALRFDPNAASRGREITSAGWLRL